MSDHLTKEEREQERYLNSLRKTGDSFTMFGVLDENGVVRETKPNNPNIWFYFYMDHYEVENTAMRSSGMKVNLSEQQYNELSEQLIAFDAVKIDAEKLRFDLSTAIKVEKYNNEIVSGDMADLIQKSKPNYIFTDKNLGEFRYNARIGVLYKQHQFGTQLTELMVDDLYNEDLDKHLAVLFEVVSEPEKWTNYAYMHLTKKVQSRTYAHWYKNEPEFKGIEINREFIENKLSILTISIEYDGNVCFCFDDAGLFAEHQILLTLGKKGGLKEFSL